MERKNKYLIMLFIFMAIVTIAGTFAWLTYRSKKTALVFTVGSIDGMSVTLKPYQINATLTPTNDYTSQEYVNITSNNKNNNIETFELYYEIDEIDTDLISEGFKYIIVKSADNWTTQSEVKTGNFLRAASGDTLTIYSENIPGNNTTYQYKVYLWIDSSDGNQSNMQGKSFEGSLKASITTCFGPETVPTLDTGMISVSIANNGVVTTISPSNSSWYNYCEKKWANAVLVKETHDSETDSHDRSYYKTNSTNGTNVTVTDSDILAYFVWIPRYSYKVWQYTGVASTVKERTIDIKFIDSNTKESATGNGQWYTHPAFTFGNTELDGIWVSKFETSTITTDVCYITPGTANCAYSAVTPRIVPGVDSLRYQSVSDQFQTALKFAGGSMTNNVVSFTGSSTYGLTTATDSHMMKNSEWGAVAYLSHSKYGINTEVRKNNFRENSSPYRTSTGCGANIANANTETTVTTCALPYGTPSNEIHTYPQSTTGNISGVFDMSGGALEYVMGNYGNTIGSGGFAATWFSTTGNSKYYNLYDSNIFTGTYETNSAFCTLATCGGHALNETSTWYLDHGGFVYSGGPWFWRGGFASTDTLTGVFYSNNNSGSSGMNYSFRTVLVNVGNN